MRHWDQEAISAVGRNITKYRTKKGLSVRKLATLALTDPTSISEYEHGKIEAGITKLTMIAKALEIHPGKLFDGFDE